MLDRMETWQVVLCVVSIATWTSITWETNRATERPVESIVLISLFTGALLLGEIHFAAWRKEFGAWRGQLRDRGPASVQTFHAEFDRADTHDDTHDEVPYPSHASKQIIDRHTRHKIFRALIIAAVFRVATLWVILGDFQCSVENVESMIYSSLIFSYNVITEKKGESGLSEPDDMSRNVYEDIYHTASLSAFTQLIPNLLFCLGATWIATSQPLRSTYICRTTSNAFPIIFGCQIIGSVLDSGIHIGIWRLLGAESSPQRRQRTIGNWLVSVSFVLAIASASTAVLLGSRFQTLFQISSDYFWAIATNAAVCFLFALCIIRLSSEVELLPLIFTVALCCAIASLPLSIWENRDHFPAQANGVKLAGILCLFISCGMSMRLYRWPKPGNHSVVLPTWLVGLIVLILTAFAILASVFTILSSNEVGEHPITTLMLSARVEGDRWLTQASQSASLKRAVLEYKDRNLGRDPPPNFDKWYEFALNSGAPVIDNYDSIGRDLLPFWAIPAAKIRELTPGPMKYPNGLFDMAIISIRNGTIESSERQYRDEVMIIEMVREFAHWLPDLDIAFNLIHKPRAALTWTKLNALKESGRSKLAQIHPATENTGFSQPTEHTWLLPHRPLMLPFNSVEEMIRSARFDETVFAGCAAWSPARKRRKWVHPRTISPLHFSSYSAGPFISNWTEAADLCNQPDVAELHAFLGVKPAERLIEAYDGNLFPIFSPYKTTGFNDILFPFPETYTDGFTMPQNNQEGFFDLRDEVFYRARLSRDFMHDRSWQGQQSSRLVHESKALSPKRLVPMLLPTTRDGFYYANAEADELKMISDRFDMAIETPKDVPADFQEQIQEFGATVEYTENLDIGAANGQKGQKFHVRYPVSMDSYVMPDPLSLTWLRSKAAPIRTSIFRAWYDDRIIPWLHFIPLDIRFQEMFSTMAYFSGFEGKIKGKDVTIEGRPAQAAFIADQGRKWAEKALRREDASVYAFRLLLEYGRLVDDNRDNIGYVVGK